MKLNSIKAVLTSERKRTSSSAQASDIEECALVFLSGDEPSRRKQFETLKNYLYQKFFKNCPTLIIPRHRLNRFYDYERAVVRLFTSNEQQVEAYLMLSEQLEEICNTLDIPYRTE